MPLNGTYIDCAVDDGAELKDTIKMVYNIDVSLQFNLTIIYHFPRIVQWKCVITWTLMSDY